MTTIQNGPFLASLSGLTLSGRLDGPSDAPIVCLAHCFGSNHHFWTGQMPWLEQYRVLRFDARGHGASSCPPGEWSVTDMANDIVALLDYLRIERVHLAGASMGGMAAMATAIEFPDRLHSVALITTTFEYSARQQLGWQSMIDTAVDSGTSSLQQALMQRWFSPASIAADAPGYQFMRQAFEQFSGDSFARAAAAILRVDLGSHLTRIQSPTLVIASENDPGVPAELSLRLGRDIAKAQFHWTPFAHHLASLEHPDWVGEIYARFLDSLS